MNFEVIVDLRASGEIRETTVELPDATLLVNEDGKSVLIEAEGETWDLPPALTRATKELAEAITGGIPASKHFVSWYNQTPNVLYIWESWGNGGWVEEAIPEANQSAIAEAVERFARELDNLLAELA